MTACTVTQNALENSAAERPVPCDYLSDRREKRGGQLAVTTMSPRKNTRVGDLHMLLSPSGPHCCQAPLSRPLSPHRAQEPEGGRHGGCPLQSPGLTSLAARWEGLWLGEGEAKWGHKGAGRFYSERRRGLREQRGKGARTALRGF